jgi:hypothetical protein
MTIKVLLNLIRDNLLEVMTKISDQEVMIKNIILE